MPPEMKTHAQELARLQAQREPSINEKLSAMETRLSELMIRADSALPRKDDDRRRDDDDDDRRDARVARMIHDAVEHAMKKYDRRRHEDDNVGGQGEPEPMSADDDRKREDGGDVDPEDGEVRRMRKEGEEGAQEEVEDDRRGDSATISRLRNEVAELRRGMKRVITDEDMNRLAEKQSEWDKVAQMHGHRASRPLDGERVASYDRRMAKVYQKHSPKWKDQDLGAMPIEVVTKIAAPEIRADSVAYAYKEHPSDGGTQREVRRQDRTGRFISEFVGPVNAINGALAPFRMAPLRARFNRNPDKYD